MAQVAFSVCISPCDFSYCIFLVLLASLLPTALLFPEVMFSPCGILNMFSEARQPWYVELSSWYSCLVLPEWVVEVGGALYQLLLWGGHWIFGSLAPNWGQIAAFSLLPGATEWFEEESTRQQGYLMQEDRWCLKGGIMNRVGNPHCHSAASQLCLGTDFAGECLK